MAKRVLVADNDALLRRLLRRGLEEAGYEVLLAADGLEAWRAIEEAAPDYLVLDLVMPKLDGGRLCRRLKSDPRFQALPVLILTGAAPEASQHLGDIPADAYLAKRNAPATLRELVAALEALEAGTAVPRRRTDGLQSRQIVSELLAETAHLTAVLQRLGEGVLLLDLEGQVVLTNPAALQILQRSESELLGARLKNIIGGEARGAVQQLLQRVIGGSQDGTDRAQVAHGDRRLQLTATMLEEAGQGLGVVLLIQDITPVTQRIQELITLNELAALFTSTLELDVVLARVMDCVRAVMRAESATLFLREPGQDELVVRATAPAGPAPAGNRQAEAKALAEAVCRPGEAALAADAPAAPEGMLCVPLMAGTRVLGALQVAAALPGRRFRAEERNLLHAIAGHAATAIENARLHEAARQQAAELEVRVQERTAALEKALQAKAEFLAKVSHELRTPLNFILGFADLLHEQEVGPLTPRQAQYVERIRAGGRHLLELVRNLLDLSLLNAGRGRLELERFLLSGLVQEVLDMFSLPATQKRLALTAEIEPSLQVVAERRKLFQVVANLVGNAVKFTPEDGTVRVTGRRMAPDSSHASDGEVELAVEDTGIGISPNDLERIFLGFEQLDSSTTRRYGGAGIGLALARTLVELHGGRIWAESPGRGHGARFVVRLPPLAPPAPKRVLVVEDDAALQTTLAQFLETSGYRVESVGTGADALAALSARRPDLIVLDLSLPDVSGHELLGQIRGSAETRALPVLILTGLSEEEARAAVRHGADDFLTKPFSPTVLLGVVQGLLARSGSHGLEESAAG
ncbi:MAG TPA: response regulator [Candidatus Sulfotelmatobacter sp.]|nr:response regulator [Candidatus Sulfotelmatobacter sp.]